MIQQKKQQQFDDQRAQRILTWRLSTKHKHKSILNLSNCDEDWQQVMKLYLNKQKTRKYKLHQLILSGCKITLVQLAKLLLQTQTQYLYQNGYQMATGLIAYKIGVLDLSQIMLGMRGAALLVKVDWLNLRSLIMQNCGIRNQGFTNLMKLKSKCLTTLDISEYYYHNNKQVIVYGLKGLETLTLSSFKNLSQFLLFNSAEPVTILIFVTIPNRMLQTLRMRLKNQKLGRDMHQIMKTRFINYH